MSVFSVSKKVRSRPNSGFSMLEILVVVAILALLIISLLLVVQLQLMRSRDAIRKGHLEKLKVAFEGYYNDNDCYPPTDVFFNGGSEPDGALCNKPLAALEGYLDVVPCDPETEKPYTYYPLENGEICSGYRLYAKLEDENDQGIPKVGCTKAGCGAFTDVNYGVAVGGTLVQSSNVVASPTPTFPPGFPTGFNGNWVCSPNSDPNVNGGQAYCKTYLPVQGHGCGASLTTQAECALYCYTGSPIICSD